jgi:alpha-tubulin suppressor-like RCC1 family protein
VAVGLREVRPSPPSPGRLLAAGPRHSLGVRADGTVLAAGAGTAGEHRVQDWTDVVVGWRRTLGLRADGSVLAVGSNEHGQCGVPGWEGLTA